MVRAALVLASLAACRTPVDPRVDAPRGEPTVAYGELLARVVTDDGLVDYDMLEAERGPLDRYVAWLGKPRRVARANIRHAFWLNAYNALVLYGVLEAGRPDSVLDVRHGVPVKGVGFFIQQAFLVDGQRQSLWEIEHERLRGRVMDIRDHGALNCASMSCPPLRNELYAGGAAALNQQLRDQMAKWINDPVRGVRIEEGEAVFSPIFDWYAHDFDLFTAGDDLCTTAARFADPPLKGRLHRLAQQGCPHRFFDYDWALNDAGRATR